MDLDALLGNPARFKRAWQGIEISGLTADSREVRPGYLFAALAGTKTDGAGFISQACAKGAAAILVHEGADLPSNLKVPVISDDNPRRTLALAAARFFARQPEVLAAVTGTNGKTSVASFLRQIWEREGFPAASMGTVGVVSPAGTKVLRHTTPDPVGLHAILADLADEGVSHAVLEASSHGLAQYRLDGARLTCSAFTNISRDHLDYHASFEDYLAQKMRLFTEVAPRGSAAVIDTDSKEGRHVAEEAGKAGLRVISVGRHGEGLRLAANVREGFSQMLTIDHGGAEHEVALPLAGDFQVSNALVAAGMAIGCGMEPAAAIAALAELRGASGRLELVGQSKQGAPVFIDYAHTPEALVTVLKTLRPYAKKKLIVVFGAGGDRDKGKRPLMGKSAARHADICIVTDDNPRSESPSAIREAILAAAPEAIEIGDRATAIAAGVAMLRSGDVLVVAGKGHETGQEIGGEIIPYSDHEAVQAALNGEEKRRVRG